MIAITVSIDFSDFLSQALPHNRKHFEQYIVVTNHADTATADLARTWDCDLFRTEAFTQDSAYFNKYRAWEEAADYYQPSGWIASMDADVVLPKNGIAIDLCTGNLYGPRRRMWRSDVWDGSWDWSKLPIFPDREWAGFCQIYSTADAVLCERPWHDIWWKNGCGDSSIQARWPTEKKIRPDWEVLHIGKPCRYRYGRSPEALKAMKRYQAMRRPGDKYVHEKIRR
jgi:hypothetical protein